MKKIPSLFVRNYKTDRLIRDEVVPGCEWVLGGEGNPTRKYDGTSCMVSGGKLYKRYDAKKRVPPGFIPCEEGPDHESGHWPGWIPVEESPENRWHLEAWNTLQLIPPDNTYELIGPKINGGAERWAERCIFVPHGCGWKWDSNPRTFEDIRRFLSGVAIEGIVWWHDDGRKAKVKRRDFGLEWPSEDCAGP